MRLGPSRDFNQAGSSGARSGFELAVGAATFDDFAFVLDREPARREARGELTSPSDRAASMSARAAVRDGNGPRTRGSPSSSVRSPSTTTHVPDWGSIVKRSSRLCQRPPPRRFRDPDSAMTASIGHEMDDAAGSPLRHRRRVAALPVHDRERGKSAGRLVDRRVAVAEGSSHPRARSSGSPTWSRTPRPAPGS